jgi:hypothetical protein
VTGLASVAFSADVTTTFMRGPALGVANIAGRKTIQQGLLAAIPMAMHRVRQARSVPGMNR